MPTALTRPSMAARRLGAAGGALWGLPGPYDKRRGRCPRALVSMNNSCPRGSAWVCRPCACRCCSLALPAQRAPHEREEPIPLPLVLGDLGSTPPVRQHCPKSGLPDRLNKTPSSPRPLRVREPSQPIRRQTVVYQRIALFDERCCNDSLRNTHVNKNTLSLTPGACCITRRRNNGP